VSRFCFTVACDLREDTPQQVIETLRYMTSNRDYDFNNPPDLPFFKDDDWRTFLVCESEGFIFPGEPHASLREAYRYSRSMVEGGEDVYLHTLSFRCQAKDDGITSYLTFIEWLAPYSSTTGFVGYWIYEDDEDPILIYFKDGQISMSKPSPPQPIQTENE
jgi:hypothetical protein